MRSTTATPKELSVPKKVCVVMAAIYLPYTMLFLILEWDWVLVELWPIFPGVVIHGIQARVFRHLFNQNLPWPINTLPAVILFTLVPLSVAIFAALKARKHFGRVVIGLGVIAFVFVFFFRLLLMA